MKFRWYYAPMLLTTLPTMVLFLFVMVFIYRVDSWHWKQGCLEFVAKRKGIHTRIWGKPAGQCWGTFALVFAHEGFRENRVIPVHERVHALHGAITNTAGMAVFAPLGYFVWWPIALLGPATFGILYGAHFLFEWTRSGFGHWYGPYLRIWSERVAYRIDDEYERGLRPGAWGG